MRLNHEIFFLSCVFCSFHVVFFCTTFFRSVIEGRSGTVAVDLVEVVFIDRRERGRPIFLDMEVSQVCWKSLVTSPPLEPHRQFLPGVAVLSNGVWEQRGAKILALGCTNPFPNWLPYCLLLSLHVLLSFTSACEVLLQQSQIGLRTLFYLGLWFPFSIQTWHDLCLPRISHSLWFHEIVLTDFLICWII